MIVTHSCGHEVLASPYSAPYMRRELCDACKQLARELMAKQHKLFKENPNENTK